MTDEPIDLDAITRATFHKMADEIERLRAELALQEKITVARARQREALQARIDAVVNACEFSHWTLATKDYKAGWDDRGNRILKLATGEAS